MTDQRTVRGVHWRKQPCPVELRIDDRLYTPDGSGNVHVFACQKQQTSKGPVELPHHHRWDGRIDNQRVTVIWRDEGGS